MKLYIAAKYGHRFMLRPIVERLEAHGIESTAQWINNAEESKSAADAARMDVDDVLRADALLFFAEPKGSMNTGGGRYFELGLAYSAGKDIVAVVPGHPQEQETIFFGLPEIVCFADGESALNHLIELAKE